MTAGVFGLSSVYCSCRNELAAGARPNVSCEDVKSALDAYLDGELDAARTRDIERHLESCSDCRTVIQRRTQLKHVLLNLAVPPVPEDLAGRIVAQAASGMRVGPQGEIRIRSDRTHPSRSRTIGSLRSIAAAALVVVGLAMGSVMSRQTWRDSDSIAISNTTQSADDSNIAYGFTNGTDVSLVNAYYSLGSGNESGI